MFLQQIGPLLAHTGFGLFQGVFEGGLASVVGGGGFPSVAIEVGSRLLRRNCQRLMATSKLLRKLGDAVALTMISLKITAFGMRT